MKFKIVEAMTQVVDNLLECLTIQICVEKKKYIIISCVYRAPGSSIETFTEWIESVMIQKGNKNSFICRDYNIDLLNPNKQQNIDDVLNLMHSLSLFPTITRPTRLTSQSATLIDKIFTNIIENRTTSGLLITDITDHLPVFKVYDNNVKSEIGVYKQQERIRTDETIATLKHELMEQNWDAIYKENDVNNAYHKLMTIFTSLYNKHCPIKEYNKKTKYKNSPWLTKGLRNACKKKNLLYRNFIKQRTEGAEDKYKRYKKKLTNIIRLSKKEYYKHKLEDNKNNIKGIWTLLNHIIREGTEQHKF
nr:uncharacterized protein LOC125988690 [Syngnathus scovelli]